MENLRLVKLKEKNESIKEQQNEINLAERSKRELLILEKINSGISQLANEVNKLFEYEYNDCKNLENKREEYLEQIALSNRNKEKSAKNIESFERQILKNKEAMENLMNIHQNWEHINHKA